MNCHDCLPLLDSLLDDRLSPPNRMVVRDHVHHCAACSGELDARRALLTALRALPAPSQPIGLAARVLPRAPRRRPYRWPLAAAASLLVALLAWQQLSAPQPAPLTTTAAFSPNEAPQPVRLVFRSPQALTAVTIELQLPPGTRLAHTASGQRTVRWQTDLRAGANLLELPLVFEHAAVDAILTASLRHGDAQRQFVVPVRTPAPPPLSEATEPAQRLASHVLERHHV